MKATDKPYEGCDCMSHHPADHQGACGHCGAAEDELCRDGCPVDGPCAPHLADETPLSLESTGGGEDA